MTTTDLKRHFGGTWIGEDPAYSDGPCPICGQNTLVLLTSPGRPKTLGCSAGCDEGDILTAAGLTAYDLLEDVPAFTVHTARPAAPPDEALAWEAPLPFHIIDTPSFPIDTLPACIACVADALSRSTQTPTEMAGILSLGVLATAFQRRHWVQVTPDWKEPLALYTVAIAPPGERKTAVISALMAPVYAFEKQERELQKVLVAQNHAERSTLEKALQNAQAIAAKKPDQMEAEMARIRKLSAQLAEFKTMNPYRLVVDDTTPEKLIDIMHEQGGSITVASAEGGVFDNMSGRYDNAASFDIYLKGHAGDTITVDRIGRAANEIHDPRLTMLLTIQPQVLAGLISNTTFKGRGLCGRFLYAMCKSTVGRRDSSPPPVPEDVRAAYHDGVRQMLAGQDSGPITLDAEADALRVNYAEIIEKRLGGEWEFLRDWGGKLVGAAIRIAGLLHAADSMGYPTRDPISGDEMARAIRIAEFLGPHAEAAYQMMGADTELENARYLLSRIEKDGYDGMSKRELFCLCQRRFRKVEAMERPLRRLESMGYIKVITPPPRTGAALRRVIRLNPSATHAAHAEVK